MTHRPTTLALAATAAASLLAGCGLAGAERSADAGADDRVRVAHLQPPRSGLSPLSDDAFKLSRWSAVETLVTLDEAGDALPGLATGWKQTRPRTWTFDLRDGVDFHDGTALDADAVVGSLRAAVAADPVPRILDGTDLRVEAAGADEVVVTTDVVDPLLPQRLSSPQLAILSPAAYADGRVDPVGTGTGPFELVDVDGTVGATLDRFEGYWGEPARVAGIDATFVPDGTARTAAIRTGTADVVEAVPAGQAAQVDEGLLHEVAMPRTNTIHLNAERGVFRDPGMRAAVREAIDPGRIVEDVYEGRADLAQGLLGPALPWAASLRGEVTRRAPAAVAGERITPDPITLATFTDRAELPEVAVLLEQQLEAAGFEVEQVVREYQFVEEDALAGEFDAFVLSRATVLDSGDPVAYLASDFTCDGSFNLAQLCDPAVDRAVAAAGRLPAGEARRAAVLRAEAAVLATDAALPMLHERVLQGESARVGNVERDPRERALITNRTTLDTGS